jgi:hypothetical protein
LLCRQYRQQQQLFCILNNITSIYEYPLGADTVRINN